MGSKKSVVRPLGTLLVEQGSLSETDVAEALSVQLEDGKRLGEILLERDLVSRPLLARALAEQSGVQLVEEPGFGSGLRALIERRHQEKKERRQACPQSPAAEPTDCAPSSAG